MKKGIHHLTLLIMLFVLTGCPEEVPEPAQLSLSNQTLDFSNETSSLSFTISNPGEEALEWTITSSEDWISVNPTSGTTSDLESTINVEVDRTGLVPSDYTGTITISSNVGSGTVSVSMSIVYNISKIAFTRDNSNNYNEDIFIMNHDGTGLQQLTQNAEENIYPCWSPDGEFIFFSSDRYNDDGYDIFRMAKSGLQATQLTSGNYDMGPRVSPDGTKVLFGRIYEPMDADDYVEIFIMNFDGSDQIQLTNNKAPMYGGDWSRDGNKIYYASGQDGDYEIYSMGSDGFHQIPITQNQYHDFAPTVSMDNKIVFVSDRDGDDEIFIMNTDGSNAQQLTNNDVDDWDPCCSKTENKIVFVSGRDGDPEIFVMNIDGTSVIQLTQNEDWDFCPNW